MRLNYEQRIDNVTRIEEDTQTRRPEVLSIFAKGLDRSFDENPAFNSQFDEFDTFDLSYVVRVVLSLVAILLGAVTIVSEKSLGTLKLVLANELPRDSLLVGKMLSDFLQMAAIFLMGLMLSLLLHSLSPVMSFSGDVWIRVSLFGLMSLLYLLVFLNAGLLISCSTHHPTKACAMAMAVWIAMVLILPSLTTLFAKQYIHTYSSQEITAQRREIRRATMSFDDTGTKVTRDREKRSRLMAKLHEQIRNQVQELSYFSEKISRITPSASYLFCVTSMCRTGLRDYFVQQDNPEASRLTLSESLSEILIDFSALAIWGITLFLGAFFRFRTYDVT